MLPRGFRRSSANKAIALLERSISSSKHSLKQTKETSGYVRSQPKVELPPEAKATPAAMPKPPSSQSPSPSAAAGSSSAAASSSSSSWQFHPSIPIDVRLLGAGALGTGALLYSLTGSGSGGSDNNNDKKKEISNGEEENVFVIEDESTTSTIPPVVEIEVQDTHSQVSSSPSSVAVEDETEEIKKEEENEESEPAIVVDSHEVLKMIEDVLSKPAEQMLSEDEAALLAAGSGSNNNIASKREEKEEAEVQAAQVAITIATSDTAAESVASDIVKASKGVDAMNPVTSHLDHHHHHDTTVNKNAVVSNSAKTTTTIISDSLASASATLAGINPDVINILGLHADLTAAGLLADAMKSGSGPGDNWEEYAYRHKQAESDAEILGSLLDSAAQNVKKQLAAAQAAAIAGHEEAEEVKKEAALQAERFRAALTDALQRAEEGHRVQMNQQAEKLANAHAEMTVRERVERQKIVDQLRKKLGALERALEKRADAARGSTTAHRMAQGAFALQETLDKGGKVDQAVEFLTSPACGVNDPLLSAAVRAVPRGKRILTPLQLTDEFTAVEKAAKELSLLPAGHGGMLSAAVAKMVSKLKLKEGKNASLMLDNSSSVGIDAKLGEVEAEVVSGNYTQAAKKLEEAVNGTAAALAVKDWVEAARARAAAEQAVAVVEAHAATAALSLA